MGIPQVKPEILAALGFVFEKAGLLQRTGVVPHKPPARRIVDLTDDLKAKTRFTDAPRSDGGEHLHKLFLRGQSEEVLELVEEVALADERMLDGVAGDTAGGPLVHGFG